MKIRLLCIGLLFPLFAFSQTITVKDAKTQKPIELVNIISQKPRAYTLTNSKGQAELSSFSLSQKIVIRTLGYKTRTLSYKSLKALGFELFLEASNLNLDEVVISATGWREAANTIPNKVVSISAKDVNFQNPQTAADLLGLSGNVYVQKSQQGGGSPMIRGFATNRLLYTIDGVRMNTAIFRGGNIQNVISLDPFAIENTEVFFGPGSVIYGSDAIGGVMSFSTLTPQLSTKETPFISGKASSRFASANSEKTGHLDLNIGLKKWGFVSSISSWDYGELIQGANGPDDYLKFLSVQRIGNQDVVVQQANPRLQDPSAYAQVNLMQKVLFKPNAKWSFQYGFHHSRTSSYGRYDRHNRFKNGVPRYGEWSYGPQQWMMHNLNINYVNEHVLFDEFSFKLAQQSFEESRISRNLHDVIRTTRTEQVDASSVNFDFIKIASPQNTLYYGFEYIYNDVTSNGRRTHIEQNTIQPGSARYPNASWKTIAFYINDDYKVSKTFNIQSGIRYSSFTVAADFSNNASFFPLPFSNATITNGALTGSIGAVYRPNKKWVLSTNLATAFRAPNVDDVGKIFDSEPGALTVPNPDLKEEYAYSIDVGIAKVIGNSIKLDVSGYYTFLKDALVRRDFLLNGQSSVVYDGELSRVQAIQNAGNAHVYGIQSGIEIKLSQGLSFSTDVNYQVGEEKMDDGTVSPSRHAAPFFGTSRLSYTGNKLKLQLYSVFQGERAFKDLALEERNKDEIYAKDANGNNYAPSWLTFNVKSSYDISDHMTLNIGVENITDQRYRPYSSGISGAGRNLVLSLSSTF